MNWVKPEWIISIGDLVPVLEFIVNAKYVKVEYQKGKSAVS